MPLRPPNSDLGLPRLASTRFDEAVTDFAEAYAYPNERDHATLAAEFAAGRVKRSGVGELSTSPWHTAIRGRSTAKRVQRLIGVLQALGASARELAS